MASFTEHLWDAIERIALDDGTDKLTAPVLVQLIEFKMVELTATGKPQLTTYGEKCFVIMESGDGEVPELNDMAAMEAEQERR